MLKIPTRYKRASDVLPRDLVIRVKPGGITAAQAAALPVTPPDSGGGGDDIDIDCLLLIHTAWVNGSVIATITDIEGNPVEGATISIAECP